MYGFGFRILFLFFFLGHWSGIAQEKKSGAYASFPVDERTGRISYQGVVEAPFSKEKLFKRAEQFVISQDFERAENIRCKDKSHVLLRLVENAITYLDFEEGKILGNGFVNFSYRGRDRFVITFRYQLTVKDFAYRYAFTDFIVLEFVTAPKDKSKSTGVALAGNGVGFGKSSGFVEFSANDVRRFELEDFILRSAFDKSEDEFRNRIKRVVSDLETTMKDDF